MLDIKIIQKELNNYNDNIWLHQKEKSKNYIERFKNKSEIKIEGSNKYYLHVPLADMHFGNDGTDYETAEYHAKIIGKCEHALAYNVGDSIDNFIKAKIIGALINQTTTPKEQIKLLQTYFDFFNGHMVLMIGGNHSYHGDTEILTELGWKNIKDIILSDNVAQYDIENKTMSFVNPSRLHRHFEKEYISIESWHHKQIVTLDHDVIVNAEKIKAQELLGKKINEKEFPVAKNLTIMHKHMNNYAEIKKLTLNEYAYCVTVEKGAIITRIHGKIGISGNCRWTKEVSGLDWLSPFTKSNQVAYSPDIFNITFLNNKIKYLFKFRHQYRFNSYLNPTHSAKQMLRNSDYIYDVGCVAHQHEVAMAMDYMFGEPKLHIRCGTYKIADVFARSIGYNDGKAILPCFITSPKEKNIIPFWNIEQAIDYVNYLNKKGGK